MSAGPVDGAEALAGGGCISRAEPIMLLGEAGTGKTHIAISLVRRGLPPAPAGAVHHRRSPGQ
jgi:serine kinase of HPr protein (carbohydrate metabolism regulator)